MRFFLDFNKLSAGAQSFKGNKSARQWVGRRIHKGADVLRIQPPAQTGLHQIDKSLRLWRTGNRKSISFKRIQVALDFYFLFCAV